MGAVPGPIAVRRSLEVEEADQHRQFDCKNYMFCLDVASVLGWKSFSCALCNGDCSVDEYLKEYIRRLDDDEFDEFDKVKPFYVPEFTLEGKDLRREVNVAKKRLKNDTKKDSEFKKIRIFTGNVRIGVEIPYKTPSDKEKEVGLEIVRELVSKIRETVHPATFDIEIYL